jgi:hypothetical protein
MYSLLVGQAAGKDLAARLSVITNVRAARRSTKAIPGIIGRIGNKRANWFAVACILALFGMPCMKKTGRRSVPFSESHI